MEGCNKYCSYCVVPYTRGDRINRPFEDVLVEVAGLADQGVKEVTLLGQNVNAWRNPMGDTARVADFACCWNTWPTSPASSACATPPATPTSSRPALIAAYDKHAQAGEPPAPAGAARQRPILMAMKRGYTAMEYKSTVRKLRAIRPDMAMSSDFIVGFPGETEDDFGKMMKLIDDVGFDNSFSFIFSPRPGTPAPTCTTTRRTTSSCAACSICRPSSTPTCPHQREPRGHGAAHSGGRLHGV
jgi:tRNA-2-methylthio-N6-dimethylallyladenosine synthase